MKRLTFLINSWEDSFDLLIAGKTKLLHWQLMYEIYVPPQEGITLQFMIRRLFLGNMIIGVKNATAIDWPYLLIKIR